MNICLYLLSTLLLDRDAYLSGRGSAIAAIYVRPFCHNKASAHLLSECCIIMRLSFTASLVGRSHFAVSLFFFLVCFFFLLMHTMLPVFTGASFVDHRRHHHRHNRRYCHIHYKSVTILSTVCQLNVTISLVALRISEHHPYSLNLELVSNRLGNVIE